MKTAVVSGFLEENPQANGLVNGKEWTSKRLLDSLLYEEMQDQDTPCEAVVITGDEYDYAQAVDQIYCHELKILKSEVVLIMNNNILVYELLGNWGYELVTQMNNLIYEGVYMDIHDSAKSSMHTYFNNFGFGDNRRLRGGKGGKGKGGKGAASSSAGGRSAQNGGKLSL